MQSKPFFLILSLAFCTTASITAQTKTAKDTCTGEDQCCKKITVKKVVPNKNLNTMTVSKKDKVVSCKLTSSELQKRKSEAIALLKANVLERKQVANGYQYSFKGTDKMLDELITFIKSERACCDFFTFKLSIEADPANILLTITGPKGAKEFIDAEMGL